MSKKILINATHPEENRVAIVEDGVLTELDIEVAGREPSKGNIYRAVVVRVETGLQAAFVDYGAERLGFLQIDEINFSTVKPDSPASEEGRRPRINDLLHRGQELLVQITKEERGTKGAALTTYLSLAGRYMVLMPGSTTRGVSRKAESDSQRKELKKAMSSIDLAEGVGYIVRTAALDQTREELERDYRYLIRLFESIKDLEQKTKAPALIYKESNLMIRSIRDYFTTDMDEVLIDDPQVFKEAKDFFQMVMPDQVHLVKLHQERRPIFSRYQIEDQIETLSRNKVALPSGGSIVIDPTEALVAIDVNSGKMASEQGVEATATKTNLEAAAEVGRQLRLRDLGGLIVIDFIDMRERKNMRQVENQLKKSLENDKARVSVGRISQFGLLEMSRQRIKAALTEGSYLTCPHCNGSGHQKSPETQAVALLRKILSSAVKGQVGRIDAQLPLDVAAYLLNNKREDLVEIERRYQLQIHLHGNRDFIADQCEIEIQKKEKDKSTQPEYIAATLSTEATREVAKTEPAKAEKVTVEATEPEAVDSVPLEAAETETEPAKKRRRKRRRKPASAAAGEANGSEETQDATEETAETNAEETTAEHSESQTLARKPQNRRRSQSRGKTPAATSGSVEVTVEKSPETPATTTAEQPGEATEVVAETVQTKPKRRRNRRKAKPAGDATQPGVAPADVEQVQAAISVPLPEQTVAVQAVTATEAKPKRPRRAAKKPAAVKTTEEKAVAVTPGTSEAQPLPAPSEKVEPAKRRPATRTKTKSAVTAEVPAEMQKSAAEELPVKKAPSRRAPKKAPAAAKAEVPNVAEGQVAPAVTETEAVKPKRSRAVKKKPAEGEPATKD